MSGKAILRSNLATPIAKRYDPAAACAKKIRYETWTAAERIADIHAQRDHSFVLAHHCDFCGGWHNAKPLSFMFAPVGDPVRAEGMRLLMCSSTNRRRSTTSLRAQAEAI